MKLEISNNRTIGEVQGDFSTLYPFLKIEFYKTGNHSVGRARQHLSPSILLRFAGLKAAGQIDINNEMTVGELERLFAEQFGLDAQVSRKSGGVWLETTMTDGWSLGKQNQYGKEIVKHATREFPDFDDDL